jgi:hypothetical protein
MARVHACVAWWNMKEHASGLKVHLAASLPLLFHGQHTSTDSHTALTNTLSMDKRSRSLTPEEDVERTTKKSCSKDENAEAAITASGNHPEPGAAGYADDMAESADASGEAPAPATNPETEKLETCNQHGNLTTMACANFRHRGIDFWSIK